MAEMSDEEVFGAAPSVGAPATPAKELSDAEVFGQAPVPAPAAKQEFSDAQIFNSPDVAPPNPNSSIVTYGKEAGKAAASGLIQSTVSSPLKGMAGRASGPALPPSAVMSPGEQALAEEDQRQFANTLVPVQENPLYKAGQAVENFANTQFPAGPGFENSWTRDIASGVGSVGGNIITSMLSPGAAMLSMVNSGSGEAVDNAIKAGATQDQIRRAASFGGIAGATDMVDALLPRLGSTGKVVGLIRKVGTRALKGALAEGGQEGLQQFIQNLIARGIYDPNKDLSEDVPRSALIGAIIGGGVSAAIPHNEHHANEQASPDQINKAHEALVSQPIPQGPDSSTINDIPASPEQVPQSPPIPTPDATNAIAAGSSPIEQLLNPTPTTPTVAHLQESSPLSSGADSAVAEAAPIIAPELAQPSLSNDRTAVKSDDEVMQNIFQTLGMSDEDIQAFKDWSNAPKLSDKLAQSPLDAAIEKIDMSLDDSPQQTDAQVFDNQPKIVTKPEDWIGGLIDSGESKQVPISELVQEPLDKLLAEANKPLPDVYDFQKSKGLVELAKASQYPNQEHARAAILAHNRKLAAAYRKEKKSVFAKRVSLNAKKWKLFHGTHNSPFETFKDPTKKVHEKGIFFTPDQQFAKTFSGGNTVYTVEVTPGKTRVVDLAKELNSPKFIKRVLEDVAKLYPTSATHQVEERKKYIQYLQKSMREAKLNYKENVKKFQEIYGVPKHIQTPKTGYDWGGIHTAIEMAREDGLDTLVLRNISELGGHDQIVVLNPNRVFNLETKKMMFRAAVGAGPKYNLSKLSPKAAAQRDKLEAAVEKAFRDFQQEQVNRQLVKQVVTQVAGPKAAARTDTPRLIRSDPTAQGWGDPSQLPEYAAGFYVPGAERSNAFPLIAVAVAGPQAQAIITAYHESWHAIEGTLTPEEIAILRSETEALRTFVTKQNPQDANLYVGAEPEEIWAEAAGYYSHAQTMARTKIYNGPAAAVFEKIRQLMERIRQVVAQLGFSRSADVFESFYRGEMATRREAMPVDMLERWWAREGGYEAQLDQHATQIEINSNANLRSLQRVDKGISKAPAQIETLALHNGMKKLFSMTHGAAAAVPPQVQQALAHADVMAKRHKWFWGLDRLVDLNPRFTPLLRYAERIREMRTDAAKIQDRALRIAKDWRRLGKQMEPLAQLIDWTANMQYRTPQEVANGVTRHPTAAEFQQAVQQFGVGNDALQVFNAQKRFFEGFLKLTTQNAIAEAQRTITDPVALANKIVAIQTKEQQLLSKPYFPFIRFGLHYVSIKDQTGQTVHFQTFERKGLRSAENVQMAALKKMQATLPAGHTISHGVLPESAAPFIGLPPELLESIQKDLMSMPNAAGQTPGLSQDQINAIEQLRFEVAPASSFAHHFQNKDYTPGYSDDFLRAFSRYAFHGARYYSRVKYGWALRKEIASARQLGKVASDNKIGSIANYMDDHLYNTVLDTKEDFGWFKGGIFLWVFGYSAAGATLNLSQVPMVTYPWMAAKFGGIGLGDKRAAAALARAGTQVQNFYKKGAYANQTQFEMKAINYGVQTGRISESQASELAGLAQGSTLLGLGNNKVRRGIQQFLEKGTWLFEMAEQYNRRVTYRASLELAQKFPQSKAVQEAMAKYADEYNQLVQSGTFSPSDARSVITAVHATEQTQFVYARENRPRFMRGKLAGSVFVFKTYMLNVLQLMGANKGSVMPRQLIMLLALGGLMGLPGAEDLDDIADLLGKWLFGKDFNVQRQLRQWLVEAVGDKADVVLHGLARRGFGIPALLDTLGEAPGRGLGSGPGNNVPVPVLDRSKAIGMGRILPIELGKLLDPNDADKAIADQTQNASGAVFGVGFNLYRALMDESTSKTDIKRWEKAMPRALASASRAYRAFEEGRARGKGGPNSAPTVVPFDVRDTEQMAEVIAMGLGYTPLRMSAKWDLIMAQAEAEKKLQIEQKIALQNRFEAQAGGNPEEIERANQAIRDYNDKLPDWGRGYKITPDSLYNSMQARARDKALKEAGLPSQARNKPVADYIQSLFPESVVDVRKIH